MSAFRKTQWILIFLLGGWGFSFILQGQETVETNEPATSATDSSLYIYYRYCQEQSTSPAIMQMLDTLYRMAGEQGDRSMQAIALSTMRLQLQDRELRLKKETPTPTDRPYVVILLSILVLVFVVVLIRERGLRKQLYRAKKLEERANLMKTEFVQNMSHEIRTPLNSIVGFSQILCSEFTENEETKEYAHIIEQSSENLLQLINDVLDLSNLDSENSISTQTSADITTICMAAMNQMRYKAKPEVSLIFKPEQKTLRIQTSPGRVLQVLMQLMQNALKFTEKGSIELAWSTRRHKHHSELILTVTDTGIGIPADKQAYVFERFAKLNSFVPGTGLGLSICRLIAEKMGGSLVIDSTYTQGCRMIFALPLQESETGIPSPIGEQILP
ncbi:MAG: HAMP domain-containing histidine kinase [Prevotellaceae bacterium]|jgi:signal transduction histidine kinase|nr:HAMP domain-containing histidine kinase [Prevotellaceae bacterium]